jgi:hypothetical protein
LIEDGRAVGGRYLHDGEQREARVQGKVTPPLRAL